MATQQMHYTRAKGLSDEDKAKQKAAASCFMFVKFQDGNQFGKWSNEHAQPHKFRHIGDSINEMFRIFEKSFRATAVSGAIFDTREHKMLGAHNKVYQYENGVWMQVAQILW